MKFTGILRALHDFNAAAACGGVGEFGGLLFGLAVLKGFKRFDAGKCIHANVIWRLASQRLRAAKKLGLLQFGRGQQ